MHALLEHANRFAPELIELRRKLHQQPELSFREHRTAATIAETIRPLGFRMRTGVGRTGVVAELGQGKPVVALRADMDALPIQETNSVDYCSTVAGVMHACGHDAHMAMLTGAARLLADAEKRGELRGTVRLLFQPSEECSDDENKSGAVRMIEDGAMQGVDAVFGLHIGAHMTAGKAFIRPGPYMAGSDTFTATVLGKASHVARPQEGVDAIVLAAQVVLACQNAVSRRISPMVPGVLGIGKIAGGNAENIVADTVTMQGTIRYFEEDVRIALHDALRSALRIADALGGRGEVQVRAGYPPVINDESMTKVAGKAARAVLGTESIGEYQPMMGAEDFAYLLREAPGCFFWLGAALDPPREHHHPDFEIDEHVLPKGAALLAACALERINSE
jgi:amidohydrolase